MQHSQDTPILPREFLPEGQVTFWQLAGREGGDEGAAQMTYPLAQPQDFAIFNSPGPKKQARHSWHWHSWGRNIGYD